MKCGSVKKKLSPYLDGRLEEVEAQEVRAHLESCPGCRGEMKLMRASHDSLASLGPAEVPDDLASRSAAAAFAAVDEDVESEDGVLEGLLGIRWPALLTSAAAVAAAAVIGLGPRFFVDTMTQTSSAAQGAVDPVAEVLSLEEVGLDEETTSTAVLGEEAVEAEAEKGGG